MKAYNKISSKEIMDTANPWQSGLPNTYTTQFLDEEVKKLLELEADMEAKKKVYKEADDQYEGQRTRLLNILMESGKSKYHVEGIGTISMAIKQQVSVPKNPADKKIMLEYFETLGPELYNAYVTVNHMTLNSFLKEQLELDPSFVIPGVGEKKETPELRFRKGK